MDGIILLGIIVTVALVIFLRIKAIKKRVADLNNFATQNNLSFSAKPDYAFEKGFPEFAVLHGGHNRYAYNITKGLYKGRNLIAFDYYYSTTTNISNKKKTYTHYFSGVILGLDFNAGSLFIRPENFLDKIGEAIGLDDIDFESLEFSRKFFVKAKDKKLAYDIIHQGVMEYLLKHPAYSMQFEGRNLIIYTKKIFTPQEFEEAFDFGFGLIGLIPDDVVKQ